MYGHEGPIEQNLQPREVAGWPAPYLADNPHTSVIHKIGIEDNFRVGSFIATFSFWFLVSLAVARIMKRFGRNRPRA
jgi:predicted cobalt transporter CbtA